MRMIQAQKLMCFLGLTCSLAQLHAQELSQPILQENPQTTKNESLKDMSVSFSFPHVLTLDRQFEINEHSYFEAFFGGLPISSLLLLDTKLREAGFSDTHRIAYSLDAWTFSSGLRYGRRMSSVWSLIGDLSLLYIHGGARLHLKNIDSGTQIPFMGVGASLMQPMFGLSARREWNSWALTFSVNVVLGASLSTRKTGWFPSFQEVAPEYKDAIDDGSDAAEKALASSLNHLKASFNILPGFAVSYRF